MAKKKKPPPAKKAKKTKTTPMRNPANEKKMKKVEKKAPSKPSHAAARKGSGTTKPASRPQDAKKKRAAKQPAVPSTVRKGKAALGDRVNHRSTNRKSGKQETEPARAGRTRAPGQQPEQPEMKTRGKKRGPTATAAEPAARLTPEQLRQQIVAKARAGSKPQRAAAFTLDDVRGELARASAPRGEAQEPRDAKSDAAQARPAAASKAVVETRIEQRRYEPASLADILGYNPTKDERPVDEESQIDRKYLRFYRLLAELRDHVNTGLQTHAEETLKRSSREDTGDLSGYGQHMADAGTDNFDRDFALSLVSSEQEALYEIDEAIKRIKAGKYGICELTGRPIAKERLLAVPFARYSVESQAEVEKMKRRSSQRGGVFGDATGEDGAKFLEDDSD
jgi:RNA polymerase-binding transcription factor DksA